jgi:oxaloacetate decarboxylase gamma subunit
MGEQLAEAGILLGVGMSVVFAFLTLLIGGIQSIAWFSRLFPQTQDSASKSIPPKYKHNNKNPKPTTVDSKVVAAINAAVHTHRRTGK